LKAINFNGWTCLERWVIIESFRSSLWKVNLYESGIMDIWKDYIQLQLLLSPTEKRRMVGCIGDFKKVLDVRHWVAHGRYWPLRRSEAARIH
jgi:hypothetical protein